MLQISPDMSLLRIGAHGALVFALHSPHSSNSLLAKPALCQRLHLSVSLHFRNIKVSSVQVCIQTDNCGEVKLLFLSVRLCFNILSSTGQWTNTTALSIVFFNDGGFFYITDPGGQYSSESTQKCSRCQLKLSHSICIN